MNWELVVAAIAAGVAGAGVLIGGTLQYLTFKELGISRTERDRPYLFVTIKTGRKPELRIRNVGSRPAVDVHLEMADWLTDPKGRRLSENPQFQNGFPLISPWTYGGRRAS